MFDDLATSRFVQADVEVVGGDAGEGGGPGGLVGAGNSGDVAVAGDVDESGVGGVAGVDCDGPGSGDADDVDPERSSVAVDSGSSGNGELADVTGFDAGDEVAARVAPFDVPSDETPADELADEVPADEVPADEVPADDLDADDLDADDLDADEGPAVTVGESSSALGEDRGTDAADGGDAFDDLAVAAQPGDNAASDMLPDDLLPGRHDSLVHDRSEPGNGNGGLDVDHDVTVSESGTDDAAEVAQEPPGSLGWEEPEILEPAFVVRALSDDDQHDNDTSDVGDLDQAAFDNDQLDDPAGGDSALVDPVPHTVFADDDDDTVEDTSSEDHEPGDDPFMAADLDDLDVHADASEPDSSLLADNGSDGDATTGMLAGGLGDPDRDLDLGLDEVPEAHELVVDSIEHESDTDLLASTVPDPAAGLSNDVAAIFAADPDADDATAARTLDDDLFSAGPGPGDARASAESPSVPIPDTEALFVEPDDEPTDPPGPTPTSTVAGADLFNVGTEEFARTAAGSLAADDQIGAADVRAGVFTSVHDTAAFDGTSSLDTDTDPLVELAVTGHDELGTPSVPAGTADTATEAPETDAKAETEVGEPIGSATLGDVFGAEAAKPAPETTMPGWLDERRAGRDTGMDPRIGPSVRDTRDAVAADAASVSAVADAPVSVHPTARTPAGAADGAAPFSMRRPVVAAPETIEERERGLSPEQLHSPTPNQGATGPQEPGAVTSFKSKLSDARKAAKRRSKPAAGPADHPLVGTGGGTAVQPAADPGPVGQRVERVVAAATNTDGGLSRRGRVIAAAALVVVLVLATFVLISGGSSKGPDQLARDTVDEMTATGDLSSLPVCPSLDGVLDGFDFRTVAPTGPVQVTTADGLTTGGQGSYSTVDGTDRDGGVGGILDVAAPAGTSVTIVNIFFDDAPATVMQFAYTGTELCGLRIALADGRVVRAPTPIIT